jgi:two-component system chemotaxis response regulator CheY
MTTRILLAEDNAIERTALTEILRGRSDCEITEAEDGQAAWDLLHGGFRPNLCITDLRMPRMDGRQLIEKVRSDPALAGLKVVVASTVRDRETIIALARWRINGYLLKPFDPEKTRVVLNQVMGPPQALTAPTRTLLVADDQEIERSALAAIVKSVPGWTVIEATDGQDAWERINAGLRPQLAMFDLNMPRLGGRLLLQQIRDDPELRGMRVVIISASHDREQILALARLQIAGYLLKPFDALKVKQAMLLAEQAADAVSA